MANGWMWMHRRARILIFTLAIAALVALTGFVMFAASISRYAAEARAGAASPAPGDGVLVLTGGAARVREGFRLFDLVQARRILISGVHRQTTREQLRVQAGLSPTLFACCVDVGYAALHTMGNASEARAWAETWGFRRLLVVTSNYHMPRSLMELSGQLPDVTLVPHPVASALYGRTAWWTDADALKIAMIEYLKLLPALPRIGFQRALAWAGAGDGLSTPSKGSRERASLRP